MPTSSDLHGAVIAAAYRRGLFDLVSTSEAFKAASRAWLDLLGPGSDKVVARVVRTSVDSVHRLAHARMHPTSVEWATWCDHVGPEVVLVALADVTGRRVVDLEDAKDDRLDALTEAGEHLARAVRMAARHRAPSSDGGAEVTDAEARDERVAIEHAARHLDRALGTQAVRS